MHGANVQRRKLALDAVEYRTECMRAARYGMLYRIAAGASRIGDALAHAERCKRDALRAAS